ncbi:efflux RND transporter periplasmic adaptor subunit [Vibrio astriarenae]|uniref:Efflux RND transporter periplasmic adaptor subunit n=1 Tax=Vibrio astriarenae TaxID=1481923 RepID=A0A7Z2T5N7_9VIBR|nr:HlyD family secretion protein [Vibrio astriarenae]QIA64874.1 efflux RND transporter periplasmic adaptor subunit [Vibrio astriarenae]
MFQKYITTAILAIAAGSGAYAYYTHNVQNPWTRDGQVRAHIVQVTPRVTGQIVAFNVSDNQEVKAGDTLFNIDDSQYKAELASAKAAEQQANALLRKAQNEQNRAQALEQKVQGSVSTLTLNNYQSAVETAEANVAAAKAKTQEAELQLTYTEIKAPVDGYITNLNYRIGSQVVANAPVVALIDKNSFWIEGFFKETDILDVKLEQDARVTLLSKSRQVLRGKVESIGYGISKTDGSTGNALLPNVNPNFQWIRLAQRLPVKIKLDQMPDDLQLRVGTTASVQILSN